MDQISNNLADPTWWFTGIFFILLGILLTKLVLSWIPSSIKNLRRRKAKALLLVVKKCRQHPAKVHFMTTRYWCLSSVIVVYLSLVLLFYALSPPAAIDNNYIFFGTLISAYLLLYFMVKEREVIDEIIKGHIKWSRITS